MNAVLLMGTKLGNNVIVGAGSIVHGTFGDNIVIAGNPAKVICSLEEHFYKRKERSINEAIECVNVFKAKMKRLPHPKDLSGFKFLFCPRSKEKLAEYGLKFDCSADEPDEIEESFFKTSPYWDDFENLLQEAEIVKK